jgi:RHS repeat-associated protein
VTYDALSRVISRSGADTATFTYDTLSNILTANNSKARITRTYYRGGALKTDTLRLATDYLPAQDFTKHIYGQRFGYDLDGRRLYAIHPSQLGPTSTDSVAYSYESTFGQLNTIIDVFGNTYAFKYDSLARPTRVTRLAQRSDSVFETLTYDADSRLATRGGVRSENLVYDARNKALSETVNADNLSYKPLGALTVATLSPAEAYEGYTTDALGNRIQMVHSSAGADPDNYRYASATGLLLYREEIRNSTDHDTTFSSYDLWGQLYQTQHVHHWLVGGLPVTETRMTASIYDAEQRLASTQFALDTTPVPPNFFRYVSTETYRYDALGRRIYAREVRGPNCITHDRVSGCLSTLIRTIWDGNQILYETRVQGDSGNLELEDDAPPAQSYYGVVGYLHAGGTDQPIALWKGAGDLVLPFANWRGAFVKATCPSTDCGSSVYLPANGATAFGDPPFNPNRPTIWHGSLLEGGQDQSGYQYRRNRYYDPNTGRFTQEDPLGLGGGLNLYGFANGDPITFTDPFGLSAGDCCENGGGMSSDIDAQLKEKIAKAWNKLTSGFTNLMDVFSFRRPGTTSKRVANAVMNPPTNVSGSVTVNVPWGSLTVAPDALTVNYVPLQDEFSVTADVNISTGNEGSGVPIGIGAGGSLGPIPVVGSATVNGVVNTSGVTVTGYTFSAGMGLGAHLKPEASPSFQETAIRIPLP